MALSDQFELSRRMVAIGPTADIGQVLVWMHWARMTQSGHRVRAHRYLWNIGSPRSLRFDARGLDYLGPLLGLVGDQFAEICGRTWKRRATHVGKACLQLGIDEARVDLFVQLVDNLGGRALRRADATPRACLV